MHTVLDHDGYIPAFAAITNVRALESRVAKALELPEGFIVVFDKGYICYSWFRLFGEKGVFFVTRLNQIAVMITHLLALLKSYPEVTRVKFAVTLSTHEKESELKMIREMYS